jgi:hypothetical protein
MNEFLALADANNGEEFLKKCDADVRKEHTSSKMSWLKARFNPGKRAETAITGLTSGATAAGIGVSAAAAAGATAAAGLAATASMGIAIPVLVTVVGVGYWAYNKHEASKVNQKIWDYWEANVKDNWNPNLKIQKEDEAREWFAWFGDIGISNMKDLTVKLDDAGKDYRNHLDALKISVGQLDPAIKLASTPGPKQAENKAAVVRKFNAIVNQYEALGKDMQYYIYRLNRFLMYYQMIEIIARSVLLHAKLDDQTNAVQQNYETMLKNYADNWTPIQKLVTETQKNLGLKFT